MELASAVLTAVICSVLNILAFIYMIKGPRPKKKDKNEPLCICFLCPELNKNDTEVHIVEMALGLQNLGHHVEIFTCYYDESNSYIQFIDKALDINVHGMILPKNIFGFFTLECTIFKFFWTTIRVLLRHKERQFDVVFVYQISATIPIFEISNIKTIFHYRARNKSKQRSKNFVYTFYRYLINVYGIYTINKAALVFFDSSYSCSNSGRLSVRHCILHPSLNVRNKIQKGNLNSTSYLLYLNDFRVENDFEFTIRVFKLLVKRYSDLNVKLYLSGSLDYKKNNLNYLNALEEKISSQNLHSQVFILSNISFEKRNEYLSNCKIFLYPAQSLGYSMLEAGLFSKPVLACDSGGPTEVIHDEVTGYLRPLDAELWVEKIFCLLNNPQLASDMGRAGHRRIRENFSTDFWASKLEAAIKEVVATY